MVVVVAALMLTMIGVMTGLSLVTDNDHHPSWDQTGEIVTTHYYHFMTGDWSQPIIIINIAIIVF